MIINQDIDIRDLKVDYVIEKELNNNYNIQNYLCQEKEKEIFYISKSPLESKEELFLRQLCKELDFDFYLILGLIDLESSFDMKSIGINSSSVDIGYFQLNSYYGIPYAESLLGRKIDPYNAFDNISGGIAILYNNKKYYEREGYQEEELLKMTLMSYNRGTSGANNWYRKYGNYSDYVYAVLTKTEKWKKNIPEFYNPIVFINF